jgi:hypothetical protein
MGKESRRARELKEKLHGQIENSQTIYQLWLIYAKNRYATAGVDLSSEPGVSKLVKEAFYAGVASMLKLMEGIGEDHISEDEGVKILQRLHEELFVYTKGLK